MEVTSRKSRTLNQICLKAQSGRKQKARTSPNWCYWTKQHNNPFSLKAVQCTTFVESKACHVHAAPRRRSPEVMPRSLSGSGGCLRLDQLSTASNRWRWDHSTKYTAGEYTGNMRTSSICTFTHVRLCLDGNFIMLSFFLLIKLSHGAVL